MLSDFGEGDQAHIKSELRKCIWLTYYKTIGATRIRRDASKGMALMKSTIHINQLINKYVINILIKATVSNLKLQTKSPIQGLNISTLAHTNQSQRMVPRWFRCNGLVSQVSEFRPCACGLAEWLDHLLWELSLANSGKPENDTILSRYQCGFPSLWLCVP